MAWVQDGRSELRSRVSKNGLLLSGLTLALLAMFVVGMCLPAMAFASECKLASALPEISGGAYWQLHYQPEPGRFSTNRLGLGINLDGSFSELFGYHLDFGGGLEFAGEPSPKAEAALGEAYVDAWLGPFDLRAGRQVISWGTADWVNPTNVVNPTDMLSGAGQHGGMGIASLAVPAIAGTLYSLSGSAMTGVVVLDFVPARLPPGVEMFEPEGRPDRYPDKLEVALRGETMIGGFNVYASYFSGWEDLPAAWLQVTDPSAPPHPMTSYRRMRQFGIAAAGTVGSSAVWLEGAINIPQHLPQLEQPGVIAMSSNDMSIQAVVGADYTFPSGLFVSEQLIYDSAGRLVSPYCRPGDLSEQGPALYWLSMLRHSPSDRCVLEFAGLLDFNGKSAMLLPRCTLKAVGSMEVWCALVSIVGDETSDFGILRPTASGLAAGARVNF